MTHNTITSTYTRGRLTYKAGQVGVYSYSSKLRGCWRTVCLESMCRRSPVADEKHNWLPRAKLDWLPRATLADESNHSVFVSWQRPLVVVDRVTHHLFNLSPNEKREP
jgi:hypothetical protein